MKNTVLSISILLTCSNAFGQDELGIGATILSRGGCTPDTFTMNEQGQMAFYSGSCSNLNTVKPHGFIWYYDILNPRFGSSNDETTSITNTTGLNAEGMLNVYDIDYSTNHANTIEDWSLATGRLGIGFDNNIVYRATSLGFSFELGWDGAHNLDEITLYEMNRDADPNPGGNRGIIYNITLDEYKYWHPSFNVSDPAHPDNSIPNSQRTLSVGEIPISGYWVTLTNGAYLFDFSTDTWSLKVSGGIATGASESGDYLVGTSGSNSFVIGPSNYLKTVSETGYTIEILDMNDLGFAVGKAIDNTTLKSYPCAWSTIDEVLNIYTDSSYEGLWLGLITDSGFGMYETDTGDKGAFSLFEYYNDFSENCPPDLNDDGYLDFFDISAFLMLINNGDAGADLSTDGIIDFFDISAFLTLYNAGCPGYAPPSPPPQL